MLIKHPKQFIVTKLTKAILYPTKRPFNFTVILIFSKNVLQLNFFISLKEKYKEKTICIYKNSF